MYKARKRDSFFSLLLHQRSTKPSQRHCLDLALEALGSKVDVVLKLKNGLLVTLNRLEGHNEIILDSEDGVVGDPGVVAGVELSSAALVLGMSNHDVDVSGAHGVAVHELEEGIRGAVGGQTVSSRVEAVEPVLALLVGLELAAQVVGRLVLRVLEVVLAVGGGLPDVEHGVGNGLARGDVADDTVHLGHAALGRDTVLDDGATVLAEGGVGGPEGPENGGRGGLETLLDNNLVGDLINKAEEGVVSMELLLGLLAHL